MLFSVAFDLIFVVWECPADDDKRLSGGGQKTPQRWYRCSLVMDPKIT
jgi:hypothetical protein